MIEWFLGEKENKWKTLRKAVNEWTSFTENTKWLGGLCGKVENDWAILKRSWELLYSLCENREWLSCVWEKLKMIEVFCDKAQNNWAVLRESENDRVLFTERLRMIERFLWQSWERSNDFYGKMSMDEQFLWKPRMIVQFLWKSD